MTEGQAFSYGREAPMKHCANDPSLHDRTQPKSTRFVRSGRVFFSRSPVRWFRAPGSARGRPGSRRPHLFRKKMIPSDTIIVTDRLRLRRFSKADIPFVFSASRYEGFCDGMRWSPPQREDELFAPYEANEQAWFTGSGYTFTIEDRSTADPLGRICIRRQDGSLWDLGYWTHPLHQRKGYMTEATLALIDFGFMQLGASEIEAAHATWNVASRRVLEQAGLRFIRHVPEGFQKNGKWIEEDLLSITRRQWEQETELADAGNRRSAGA